MDGLVWLLSVSMDGRWIGIGGRYKGGFRFFKTHLMARFCWAKRLLLLSSLFSQNKAH
jgi:hypothetical protein